MKAIQIVMAFGLILAIHAEQKTYFIPHSHDDLGWLVTIDQYYETKVRDILTTVTAALYKNDEHDTDLEKKRKFVYSEVGFLKQFINEKAELKQKKLDDINRHIRTGQWEFINGGMSQADSACPHYEDIIENYFYGLSYLKRNFNQTSQAAWQIDPFGHSKALLYIAKLFGMDHAVINRIGDHKKDQRATDHTLEYIHKFDDGKETTVHITTFHYSAPPSTDCDEGCKLEDFDKQKLDNFLADYNQKYKYDAWYLIGNDFNFSDGETRFDYLDYVLTHYNDIHYSLFSTYAKDFETQAKDLATFDGDFFVYDESNTDAWSGYFTTKPVLKYRIRQLGKKLRALKNFYFTKYMKSKSDTKFTEIQDLLDIAENFGIFLHHDCITGTAKRDVDDDYFNRMDALETRMLAYFTKIVESDQSFSSENEGVIFVEVFNPTGFSRENQLIRFESVRRDGADLTVLKSVSNLNYVNVEFDSICRSDSCEIILKDNLAAFDTSYYKLVFKPKESSETPLLTRRQELDNGKTVKTVNKLEESPVIFELQNWQVILGADTITLKSKTDSSVENVISYQYLMAEHSGAYILKYDNPQLRTYTGFSNGRKTSDKIVETFSVKGDRVDVRILFNKDTPDTYEIESNVKVDPIMEQGVDVILNIKTNQIKNSSFSTDSNGLFEMKREKQDRIEMSVFPVSSYIKIEDENSNMTVFVDRAEGGTSLEPGVIQLYIQRSTVEDDHKGVDQTVIVSEDVKIRHTVLNSNQKKFDDRFVQIVNDMDIDLIIFYSGIKPNKTHGTDKKAQEPVYQLSSMRVNTDFIDETSFMVRLQNIHRKESLNSDTTYETLLKTMFGDYQFEVVSFDALFKNSKESRLTGIDSKISIKPLEFQVFIARLM